MISMIILIKTKINLYNFQKTSKISFVCFQIFDLWYLLHITSYFEFISNDIMQNTMLIWAVKWWSCSFENFGKTQIIIVIKYRWSSLLYLLTIQIRLYTYDNDI